MISGLLTIYEQNPSITRSPRNGPVMWSFSGFFVVCAKSFKETIQLSVVWDAIKMSVTDLITKYTFLTFICFVFVFVVLPHVISSSNLDKLFVIASWVLGPSHARQHLIIAEQNKMEIVQIFPGMHTYSRKPLKWIMHRHYSSKHLG